MTNYDIFHNSSFVIFPYIHSVDQNCCPSMSLRTLNTTILLFASIFITSYLCAQQRTTIDSIVLRYTDTTTSSGYYLVKFHTYPGKVLLQKHGLIRSLSTQHHILQQVQFDSLEQQQVIRIYNANNNWKCSDALVRQISTRAITDSLLVQVSFNRDRMPQYCRIKADYAPYPVALATVKLRDWSLFTAQPTIRSAEQYRTARTEIAISNALPSVNYINALQQQFPELQGAHHTIGLKEELFDTTDIDLLGKYVYSAIGSRTVTSHATIMSTLMAGAGNSSPQGRGVAPKARISPSDYNRLLPDESSFFRNAGITLENHSYGTGIENYYGAEAVAYDQQINTQDTLLHVFSAGNIGTSAPQDGIYKGLTGYANLSGTFKQSKNVLTAGAIDTGYLIPALSSKGPAYDGRIAPLVVSYGQSGTSDAAAITTGISALVQEAYHQSYGITPTATLVKTILINSADDTGTPAPDYSSGFGIVNALEAVKTVKEQRFFTGVVNAGNTVTYNISVAKDISQLKVTLGWNDPAAVEQTAKALVNDLDLWITDPSDNRYDPWVLSSYPTPDSLAKAARRGRDSMNNQEQVTIDLPAAGTFQLHITARQLGAGTSQPFHIAYQQTPIAAFNWQYPAPGEMLTADKNIAVRWQTPHAGTGTLSFSADSGITWTQIASDIPLRQGNSRWNIPVIFSKGLLRMTTTDTTWTSDYFFISSPVSVNIGFNCPDSVLLYWQGVDNAVAYDLYSLKDQVLLRELTTTDTFAIISKQQLSSVYFTVRPVHPDGWAGLQSNTVNYTQQGVDCFFKQVLADPLEDNSVRITAGLSTLYQLKKIYWERLQGDQFITLASEDITSVDQYVYVDQPTHSGFLYYRIKLELYDGRIIYSDVQTVQVLLNKDFHLFPVPAANSLTLISKNLGNFTVRFTDMSGRTQLSELLTTLRQTYSLQAIAPGIYICTIYDGAEKVFVKQFIKL